MDQHMDLTTNPAQAAPPAGPPAAEAAGPDAALLALAAEWHALDERMDHFWTKWRKARGQKAKAAVDAESEATQARDDAVMALLISTRAQTTAGMLAKLGVLSTWSGDATYCSYMSDLLPSIIADGRALAGNVWPARENLRPH